MGRAIKESPPMLARDGGFVAAGWDQALDDVRALRDDSRKIIAEMQARYASDTGISALKVKFNNVLGYFVDVPAKHGDTLMAPPWSETFIHRQTLAGNVRFSTSELADLAGRISRAEEEAKARELAIFDELSARVSAASAALSAAPGRLPAWMLPLPRQPGRWKQMQSVHGSKKNPSSRQMPCAIRWSKRHSKRRGRALPPMP
jgi:DNA mismatch repair protein MutS